MTTKTRATKEYAYCPSWGTSPNTRRFRLSRDIVQSAIKVYPKGKAWQDAKRRITDSWESYSYELLIRNNGEVWLGVCALWATHAYKCPPTLSKRLTSVVELVDSW